MVTQSMYARKEHSLLFDMYKAFDYIKSSYKSYFFFFIKYFACVRSSNINTTICTRRHSTELSEQNIGRVLIRVLILDGKLENGAHA